MYKTPELILQNLIRFDTTNPPGDEKECIAYIQGLFDDAGIENQYYSRDENRPNLVARIAGRGEAPPLLLYGHVDVVTTSGQNWQHPPFEGKIVDGVVWGRGAIDMKGGIAMMLSAMLRLKDSKIRPAGDIVLLVLSDEEDGSEYGLKFLIESYPEIFREVRYALGEFGGANLYLAGKRVYPLQVAEKMSCAIDLKILGDGGHGANIVKNNAVGKLGVVLDRLANKRTPVHLTAPVRMMVEGLAEGIGGIYGLGFKLLMNPLFTDTLLERFGEMGLVFLPFFHNTVNATIIQGGEKRNVVPCEIQVELDCRLLPGFEQEDMIREIRDLIGYGEEDIEIEVVKNEVYEQKIDMGLYDLLAETIVEMDPEGIPVPLVLREVSDARFLARIGIQSYGFIPMLLPKGFEFFRLAHGADERIPVKAVRFGAESIFKVLTTYPG